MLDLLAVAVEGRGCLIRYLSTLLRALLSLFRLGVQSSTKTDLGGAGLSGESVSLVSVLQNQPFHQPVSPESHMGMGVEPQES